LDVGMDDEVWTVSRRGRRFVISLSSAAPRPLVARLTAAEMAAVEAVLPRIAEVVRRGEFSRVQLGAAFREAIGRDPFRQATPVPPVRPWGPICVIILGLGFATGNAAWWLRPAGYVVAAYAVGDLVRQAMLRRRSQQLQVP
jgi:hypothetical protein